jgi:two-component system chemotaxis response regulator CheB
MSSMSDAVGRFESSAGQHRDVVVIGASAGGVEALSQVVSGLAAELPAAVLVVLHVMPGGTSVLPRILQRAGPLPAATAVNGEALERGRVYVAPPDHHMLVEDGHVRLTVGPRENGHRPAVDPLFRSAARALDGRVVGVILSGALDDGTAGLRMISEMGGIALVQDPADALYGSMPESALEHVPEARMVPLAALADAICAALEEPIKPLGEPVRQLAKSPPVHEPARSDDDPRAGVLTAITCPECGGSLWEHDEAGLSRFKCHVGHAYGPEALEVSHRERLEGALWAAVRSLEERADLLRRLARRTGGDGALKDKAEIADRHAETLRGLVVGFSSETEPPEQAGTAA